MHPARTHTTPLTHDAVQRRGTVLLIVLVVVMMLSLGAYTFAELMVTEYEATTLHGRAIKTQAFAQSGIELAAALLGDRSDPTTDNFFHDPSRFQVIMQPSERPRDNGGFSIVAPLESDASASRIRFGMINESSKINLRFAAEQDDELVGRNMLLGLPGMTDEIADAILDWVDEDDETREFGAESDYYLGLSPAVEMKPIQTLEELLLVRDITPDLLFGEDGNRNGLLDANENDGANPPWDNADGMLQLGWIHFLTLSSRETNRALDGTEKIYVNNSNVRELYDQLIEIGLNEEEAEFICAYLAFGPSNADVQSDLDNVFNDTQTPQGAGGASSPERLGRNLGNLFGGGGTVTTPGGLNLAGGKQYTIESLYDLVDAEVEAEINDIDQTLTSPWTSDPSAMQGYMPTLMSLLTTTEAEVIRGRVDVNQARYEVLVGIPEMPESAASAIAGSQMIGSNGEAMTDMLGRRATTAWLFIEGIVDLTELRALDQYITTGGDVYSAQVVGHFDEGGPQTRMEVVIDASEYPARILSARDMTNLGTGYPPHLLQPTAAP